jgi:PAS domain S-box-containing protein
MRRASFRLAPFPAVKERQSAETTVITDPNGTILYANSAFERASGYSADIAGRELSLQEGQNFIQKPSSPEQLLETVRQCLDKRQSGCC